MGNEASTTLATANAKNQFNNTMKEINQSLGGTAQKETDGLAGCASKRESAERRKEREKEYEVKKKERAERKKKLSQQWEANRKRRKASNNVQCFWTAVAIPKKFAVGP